MSHYRGDDPRAGEGRAMKGSSHRSIYSRIAPQSVPAAHAHGTHQSSYHHHPYNNPRADTRRPDLVVFSKEFWVKEPIDALSLGSDGYSSSMLLRACCGRVLLVAPTAKIMCAGVF